VDITKIVYEILAVDDSMRYVEIMGEEGELISNKMKQTKYNIKDQRKEELLSLDLYNTKQIEQKFNKSLGQIAFTHVAREKVHQLIWYHDNIIIYCTCEGYVDNHKILEISKKIETILGIANLYAYVILSKFQIDSLVCLG
jgi:hypothetical protein